MTDCRAALVSGKMIRWPIATQTARLLSLFYDLIGVTTITKSY